MADLRNRAAAIATSPAMENAETFSTGSTALDTWLPGGGLQRGRICEWVATRESGGAGTLSMITTASAIADRTGPVIVIDPTETFYASGAIACGIPAERIVWCRCPTRRDSVWALDQALRCRAVAAVWAMLPWHLGDRDARRLQLAAEAGRTPGLFVLTAGEAHRSSFAPVRFHVDPVRSTDAAKRLQSQSMFSRPPVDTRTIRVRMSEKQQAILAITPDAKLHTLPYLNRQTGQSPRPENTRPEHAETRHEAVAVSLAARLADPTSPNRDAIGRDSSRRDSTRRRTG